MVGGGDDGLPINFIVTMSMVDSASNLCQYQQTEIIKTSTQKYRCLLPNRNFILPVESENRKLIQQTQWKRHTFVYMYI